jgi:hypothetical protein
MREPPIAQMPHIPCPDPLGSAPIGQLPKDGIDAIADPAQHSTPTVSGLRTSFAKRSLQDHADLAQGRVPGGKPVVAVAQQQPTAARCQVPHHFALMNVGGSQVHLSDHSRPTQAPVQTKAVEGLAAGMIFAKAGRVIEPMTEVCACELAHRDWHTIHDSYCRIIEQETIADEAPQPLFHGPQVGGLPHSSSIVCYSRDEEKPSTYA